MIAGHSRTTKLTLIIVVLVAWIVPTAGVLGSDLEPVIGEAVMQQPSEPITYYIAIHGDDVPSLDPQAATDSNSIDFIENLFLGLTDVNPETTQIVPELATDWVYEPETHTWTFTIRDDVPWVYWNPDTGEIKEIRKVVAGDFVVGIQRACHPSNSSLYAEVVASLIAGCRVLRGVSPDDVNPEALARVGVFAPDDTTLQVTLEGPIGYFFAMTPMWFLRAVPPETIERFGGGFNVEWTEPGNIVTNGPFVLDEWDRGVRRVLRRNPLLPADLQGPGNVERVIDLAIIEGGTLYALYQDNQLDRSGIPFAELQNVLADPVLSKEVTQTIFLQTMYLAFAHDQSPFDDVHVRRAFSASVNREQYVSEVLQGRGVPMMHFTPPGMFGAVPVNEVGIDAQGIGYDPEFARLELAAAGYPNCEGFPEVSFITSGGTGTIEFVVDEVQRVLGCDPSLFTIEQQGWAVLLQTISPDTPTRERPNIWVIGWAPDYPDANNWVFDSGLHCESSNDIMRPCDEVDELIYAAQTEADPTTRAQMYRDIEEQFFGYEGLHPIMPMYMPSSFVQLKPWLTFPVQTDGLFGGEHWNWVTIEQQLQLDAR